ncbi:helix-turn-helix transcriptional regulator [Mucilaginibacter sp. JRF]|uniref:helix-turn-helix domain-containing protein n=1 Tax=Mucilaginibacter sp. JRF TaxID=2780088 RepID=UPI00187EE530|nr:helix-turn-helix transcriptional regulator [Mucilaginibacter sp. JRF]
MKANVKKDYLIITELIYRLRINSGLTQKELANALNVPQSFVSKVETGERRLDLIELKQICLVLNSSLSEFVIMFEEEINETKS